MRDDGVVAVMSSWRAQKVGGGWGLLCLAATLIVSTCCLAAAPNSALAAPKTVVNTVGAAGVGSTGGLFSTPAGVAVNRSGNGGVPAGTFYVADRNNRRIQRFGPTGEFVGAWGFDVALPAAAPVSSAGFEICSVASECKAAVAGNGTTTGTGAGQFAGTTTGGLQGIAVDQATGNVFAADQTTRRVSVFTAKGVFEGGFGWGAVDGSAALQFCTTVTGCNAPAAAGAAAGQLGGAIGGLAVDSAGNLYVADKTNRRVDVYTPTLGGKAKVVIGVSFARAFGWGVDTNTPAFEVCTTASTCNAGATTAPGNNPGQFGTGTTTSPSDIAIDSADNVYVLDPDNKRVQLFSSLPAVLNASFGAGPLSTAFGTGNLYSLAMDPAVGHLYISGSDSSSSNKVRIAELDSAGASVDTHGADLTVTTGSGLAVAPESLGGNIYLSTASTGTLQGVGVLNEAPLMKPVLTHAGTTATFEGEVVSNGIAVEYHFEYSTDGASWTRASAADVAVPAAGGKVAVSQDVTGLSGSQVYKVRLVQNRSAGGKATSNKVEFTTDSAAPEISGMSASQVTTTEAILNGQVNPQNEVAEYHFEIGTEDCSLSACASVPIEEASLPSGNAAVPVSQIITGLQPATKYHFRLVATNATGATEGPDATFTTYEGDAQLPDARAYEMVSPPSKRGLDIHYNGSVQASTDGKAVAFASLGSFADGPSALLLNVYRAERTESGWLTRSISPPFESQTQEFPAGAPINGFSSDLSQALFLAHPAPPLLSGALPGALYVYRHATAPGAPFENLVPDATGPENVAAGVGAFNASMSAVGLNSTQELTEDAPAGGQAKAYVWSAEDEALHYIGVLPDGTPTSLSGIGINNAGEGERYAVSSDGSRAFFVGRAGNEGNEESIYVRTNLTRPQSPVDGESNCTVPADACTVEASESKRTVKTESKAASFSGAAADGSKVFFLTTEQLLDADEDTSADIYVYEPDTDSLRRISRDEDASDGLGAGVAVMLGLSDDGKFAYFSAGGRLIPGQPNVPGERSFYVWHDDGSPDGALRYVATLGSEDSQVSSTIVGVRRQLVQVSPNGRYLLFTSKGKRGDYENAGHAELYRYDAQTQQTTCVSCDASEEAATGDAAMYNVGAQAISGINTATFVSHNVLDNGRVFFESDDDLTAADNNGQLDVYKWEDGKVSLVSRGTGTEDSHFADATPSGDDVFFLTRDRLVGWDVDNNLDLYDARVNGGLPEPPPPPQNCLGDACQPPPVALDDPTPASASFSGPGNVREARHHRCAKGKRVVKVKGKSRCVDKRRRGRANNNRRAGR
jgi:hypothetical protein